MPDIDEHSQLDAILEGPVVPEIDPRDEADLLDNDSRLEAARFERCRCDDPRTCTREKPCFNCSIWRRYAALLLHRQKMRFADSVRLAPLLRDLKRLAEIFPLEVAELLMPTLARDIGGIVSALNSGRSEGGTNGG